MKRRSYLKTVGAGVAVLHLDPQNIIGRPGKNPYVRLGGPVFEPYPGPEEWVASLKKRGYRAGYCPLESGADEAEIRSLEKAAGKHDVLIAEVGAWSNPISPDTEAANQAIKKCIAGLQLADQLGARCCVNMITSPQDYFNNGKLIQEMFAVLGPHIKSCHAKDITLREDNYIPQLDEIRAGLGTLDYGTFLQELAKLDDVPLMMEHLETDEEYTLAANYIRTVGQSVQVDI